VRINLLYNKLVADTVSEAFIESFNKIAVPQLEEKYPGADLALIYEDYLSDGLTLGGIFYCPITLVKGGDVSRAFASWKYDSKKFENSVPYAYLGKENLNIEISDSAPSEIEEKIAGRVPFFAEKAIPLSIETRAPGKTFLSGKYSQSFIDLMRDEITRALEIEFSIADLDGSSLELQLVFAPESFMEHVRDNVSYRRLRISARACAPRDLWIKWTRLDGEGTYTVSSSVFKGDILFELCDEVPEKIREREYRYLIASEGMTAYKNAMSRKNFTEWRELLKRVIKRGEVTKLEEIYITGDVLSELTEDKPSDIREPLKLREEPLAPTVPETENDDAFDSEISLKLQSVLENYNIETESDDVTDDAEDINPDITELLRTLLSANNGDGEENEISLDETESFSTVEEDETEAYDELPPFDIDDATIEHQTEAFEPEEISDIEDAAEIDSEAPDSQSREDMTGVKATSLFDALSDFDYDNETNDKLDQKDREIEELKRMNDELCTRLAEMEAKERKFAELIAGYERAAEEAKRERTELIETLDAAKRREEREKDRLAEAAKIAVAERYEAEDSVDDVLEEAQRLAKEAEEKALEMARIEEEREEERRRLEEEKRAELLRATKAEAPVRYVSKVADITFRHAVDPNITKRIQEIIVTTVKYFGKEDIYMKIKATIPDPYMVRLEFLKIPENESELLADIIRVLGHSKIGIVKVLLD